MINFSIPIVCYLQHILPKSKSNLLSKKIIKPDYSKIWFSNIYKSNNEFLGHRIIKFIDELINIFTYDSKNQLISNEHISSFDNEHIDTRIFFTNNNNEISKYYQLVDSTILECITTGIKSTILSFETLTAPPSDDCSELWSKIATHHEWFCYLKDSNHNEIGTRRIYIYDDFSLVDTEFHNNGESQFECLRLINQAEVDKFGSLERYINHCKILDIDSKTKMSAGGIILDTSRSIETHKNIKFLSKNS